MIAGRLGLLACQGQSSRSRWSAESNQSRARLVHTLHETSVVDIETTLPNYAKGCDQRVFVSHGNATGGSPGSPAIGNVKASNRDLKESNTNFVWLLSR